MSKPKISWPRSEDHENATWLALLAIGAILAVAVRADIPGVNLQVVGVIIMLTGVAGIFIPSRAPGWLRRRVVMRGTAGPAIEEIRDDPYPPDVMRDPATLAARILHDAQAAAQDPQLTSYLRTGGAYAGDSHPGDSCPGDSCPGDSYPGDIYPGDIYAEEDVVDAEEVTPAQMTRTAEDPVEELLAERPDLAG
jgi:hypothetical protein